MMEESDIVGNTLLLHSNKRCVSQLVVDDVEETPPSKKQATGLLPSTTHKLSEEDQSKLGLGGEAQWHGSAAQKHLKEAVEAGDHKGVPPKDLWQSRPEYQVYSLQTFRIIFAASKYRSAASCEKITECPCII
jgi:hypothetical protein